MSIKITIVGIIFLLSIFYNSAGQNNDLKFNLVTGPNEKPLGQIRNITQDPRGYMWFAAGTAKCIYRYDGNRFTTFRHNDTDSNSLGGTSIKSVYADVTGMIWIGMGPGLDRFNPETGIFKHYRHLPNDTFSISISGDVMPILKDRQGRVWVGTANGLDRLDEKTGKFFHYPSKPGNLKSLSSNKIWDIYEDRQGVIWIATGDPWNNVDPEDGGLNQLNADGTFTRYKHDPKDPHSLIDNKVAAMYEDSRGVFWVGTGGDGLHTMDRKTGRFERHLYDPRKPEQLSRPPLKPGNKNDKITFINGDSTGAIWIGTEYSGISRYDTATKKITHYEKSNGFPDSTSWNAFTSREGELWVTTERDHLYRVDPFHRSINSIASEGANCFLEDSNGYLWVGTLGNGLLKYDPHKKLIQQFKHDPSNPFSIFNNDVIYLFQDTKDTIWVGTLLSGLQILNTATQKFSVVYDSEILKETAGSGVVHIIKDKQGLIWYSTWNGGLVGYNPRDGSFKKFRHNEEDPGSIASNFIVDLLEDRSGWLWLGATYAGGIDRLNRETGLIKHYLTGTSIFQLCEDSRGNLWAGTEKGLCRYNQKEDQFAAFFDPLSEPYSFNIHDIIEDNAKNLWLTSPSAIIRLNPVTAETFIYDSKFIFPNSRWFARIYKNKNGQLFIEHEGGFYIFFPEELEINTPPFKINITDLFINSLLVIPGKGSALRTSVEEISDLDLKYNRNNIAFNFAAIDYREPDAIKYFFMLEGYDRTWREAKDKGCQYLSLPPDKYTLRVKAINSDGRTAEKTITIRINPPWWNTWLFRIAAIIVLVSVSYVLMRWRIRQKFKLQLERLEKERQMAELKQKGTELEMQALRAQMNPHFIFNSLNSINRFILQNNKAQASEYLTKFSKLVRMILQNSQASLITLESELESLELYLNLEALRFNYHFDYKISVPKDMDISLLSVPPLILQPYVENAIWHGLMHKEEKGHLDIEVTEQNDYLYFKITDDGIGRDKAAALASKSATKHKSMGLRITANRIAILQNSETLTSPVTINDLVEADGTAAGTEVIIKMPVLYE